MSDSDRDKKLEEILDLIRRAPALNGGFDKLSDTVENIKDTNVKVLYELQLVKTNQDVHNEKIENMHKALYDPDEGLYSRVTIAIKDNELQESNIVKNVAKIEKIESEQENLSKKYKTIEEKQAAIERVAGKDLQELRNTISTRKNMMRAIWVFLTGAIAGIAKFLWDILPGLF